MRNASDLSGGILEFGMFYDACDQLISFKGLGQEEGHDGWRKYRTVTQQPAIAGGKPIYGSR